MSVITWVLCNVFSEIRCNAAAALQNLLCEFEFLFLAGQWFYLRQPNLVKGRSKVCSKYVLNLSAISEMVLSKILIDNKIKCDKTRAI